MTLHPRIHAADILDWYDGIVLALVTTSWRPGFFLLSLLVWDQPGGRRVYGLSAVEEADAARIRQLASQWDELVSFLDSLRERLNGGVNVILLDDNAEDVLAQATVPIEGVRDELFCPVEDALKPERQRWFDYLHKGTV